MTENVFEHFTHPRTLEAIDELQAALAKNRPRCKESNFKKYFLPFFTSDEKSLRMDYWLDNLENDPDYPQSEVSPNSPVDVYDDVTGAVLFTVPPIYGELKFKRAHPDQSFEVLANIALIKAKDYAVIGRKFLLDAAEGFKNPELTADQKTWISILERYNLLNKVLGKETSDVTEDEVDADTSPFSGGYNEL